MKRIGFFILPCLLSFLPMKGQSYYDDDIYYDPSKEKETPEIVITEHDNTPSYTITYSSTNDSWSDSWLRMCFNIRNALSDLRILTLLKARRTNS